MPAWLTGAPSAALLIVALLAVSALMITRGQAAPSRRLALLLTLALALTPLGFWLPDLLPLIEIYTLTVILLPLADRFLFSVAPQELDARRLLPEKLSLNQANPVVMTLYNNSDDALRVELIEPAPSSMRWETVSESRFRGGSLFPAYARVLTPRRAETLEYRLFPKQRGSFCFEPMRLRYQSRLGLLWIQCRAGRRDSVKVYPDLRRITQLRVRYSAATHGGDLHTRRLGMQGHEFSALRAYVAGDDLRQIAWRATARMDAPISQVWRPEADQPVLLLLDAGRMMGAPLSEELTRFDWALNAALSFAAVALDRGDRVGVIAFDQNLVYRSPIAGGQTHFTRLLDDLHALRPSALEPDYEGVMLRAARQLRRRALVVTFTDLSDPMASHSLARGLQAFARRHLMLVLSFRDPTLARQAAQYPETIDALYEKSVAMDLNQLRERAYADLARGARAVALDAEPGQLDETLIHRYLTLKRKTRL